MGEHSMYKDMLIVGWWGVWCRNFDV